MNFGSACSIIKSLLSISLIEVKSIKIFECIKFRAILFFGLGNKYFEITNVDLRLDHSIFNEYSLRHELITWRDCGDKSVAIAVEFRGSG